MMHQPFPDGQDMTAQNMRGLSNLGIHPTISSSSYPVCAKCENAPDENDVQWERFDQIRELTNPVEREEFGITETEVRHRMRVNDVQAFYTFDTEVPCSLRKHRHRLGYVVRTRCGETIALGKDCAEQLIEEFARVEKYVNSARDYNKFVPRVSKRLEELRKRFGEAKALWDQCDGFRRLLKRELPKLADALQQTYRVRRSRTAQEIPPGIELWDFEQREPALRVKRLGEFERELAAWREQPPVLSAQEEIWSGIKLMEDDLANFFVWGRSASQMVSRAGFARAVEINDSELRTVWRSVFDARLGREVERSDQVLERTNERYQVTKDGIVETSGGRTVPVIWPAE